MLSRRRLIAAVVPILLIWATAAGQMTGGTDPKDLRVNLSLSEKPLGIVFRTLIKEYDVRIGFEKSALDNNHDDYVFERNLFLAPNFPATRLISVSVENAPLATALDIICKQLKNYEWKFTDGVVNFIPNNGREKHLEALMDLKIREFKVTKGTQIQMVTNNLLTRPEVLAFKNENQLILSNNVVGWSAANRIPVEFDATYTDLTFRELLNKITAGKKGGWLAQRSTDDWGDDKIRYSVGM